MAKVLTQGLVKLLIHGKAFGKDNIDVILYKDGVRLEHRILKEWDALNPLIKEYREKYGNDIKILSR